ncbi:MAG: prolyl oligopeptidase family serine peptidase, partial [Luteimonas sp.]
IDGVAHRYQVFVPARATRTDDGTAPVILFLHGSGERGDDGAKPTMAGLGPYVRGHAQTFPAIVVFPQAPEDSEWMGGNLRMAMAMLDTATREFDGDTKRTYLTGMSMGGYGTWELAWQFPQRFAALVPVCGAVEQLSSERALYVTPVAGKADPYSAIAARLRDVPIWMFHGARDDVVSPEDDRLLAAAFKKARAKDARYTEFSDANHNAWDPAYSQTPELWTWLFAQKHP